MSKRNQYLDDHCAEFAEATRVMVRNDIGTRDLLRECVLEFIRTDPEVQGAVLALLAGAIAGPTASPAMPQQPTERQKPDWVLRQLQAQEGGR